MTQEEELELLAAYQPEIWMMRKDAIYNAQFALRIGIKYVQDAIDLILNEEVHINAHVREKCIEIMRNEKQVCEQALEGLAKPE